MEDSRRFQYFRRDADELESWIKEKLQTASDESYKDPTNLQAKIQKHQAFEAEVAAHSNAIVVLDNTGMEMINQDHFQKSEIRQRLDELHRLWELLLSKLAEKGMRLQQALVLVQFLRQCDEVMFWINDKETFVTTEEFGHDLEHVEVLQRKFDEFQKDMASQEFRVTDVCETADKLVSDQHPESSVVTDKKAELLEAWARLKVLATERQQELFVAYRLHQIGTWLEKQKALLSSQDFGDSPEAAEALIKKIDDLLKSMDRERKKVPPAAAKKPAAKKPAAKKGEILLPSSDCPPGWQRSKSQRGNSKIYDYYITGPGGRRFDRQPELNSFLRKIGSKERIFLKAPRLSAAPKTTAPPAFGGFGLSTATSTTAAAAPSLNIGASAPATTTAASTGFSLSGGAASTGFSLGGASSASPTSSSTGGCVTTTTAASGGLSLGGITAASSRGLTTAASGGLGLGAASGAQQSLISKRNFAGDWVDWRLERQTGLQNSGNMCYVNNILQCLANTSPLAHYVVTRLVFLAVCGQPGILILCFQEIRRRFKHTQPD